MNFGKHELEEITKEFNIRTIQDYLGYAERYLYEVIAYIDAAHAQLAIAARTEFKTYVNIRREHYDHVKYYVSASNKPITDVANARTVYLGYNVVYKGTERKAALEYADELAKKLNAEIVKNF